ncbi:VWA domain-containing protein [Psychroserpens sp.]|uniref:VWA domain-containing protein n=1 Tax=Psychroserpens sp. TaxID=2020870 RepID=UPI001B14B881|nr:VWA domain-containing protein [Psychroserpens sp.]MBO6606455.1 VWA domain-containing protein [Psychroserpens sp.]MBO6631651.1 VWA domain-containing protein [Psychroserpens sp.]MBO6653159.1 VWA domain-containing protein [Psychroserpens sp.]MBO6680813.1 VWA domain-containing protein [Psychroserpens sp.]MBO6750229.1 VWA domain-containing protein [Psychroserpens sp.]
MQGDTVFYIILTGIIALFLALFQYAYKSKISGKRAIILGGLRWITYFCIGLLLINPKFESFTYYNEKPNLVIAVDNSESVNFLDQKSNVEGLMNLLKSDQRLNNQFDLQFYKFGKEVDNSDVLSFDETQSNLAAVFERLSEVFSTSTAPTLLISDGNQTLGNDYAYSNRIFKQPIYPIILGDTVTYTDIKIQQLNVNRYAYLKNKFPVEVIITYNGNTRVDSQIRIVSGNSTLFSEPITLSSTENSKIVELTLPANRVGVIPYRVEVTPLDNEKNQINNFKNFAVEVINQKTNVAIISDMLHPDLGALKKSIESNEQRTANILTSSEFINSADDYQLVILYQPSNNFRRVLKSIEDQKLNKIIVAGPKTNFSLLNQLQSNFTQDLTNQTENYQATLNQNYSTFIVDDLNFEDFPPLESKFGAINFTIPFQSILYKTVNGTQLDEPLIATYEFNSKREALILGEGIWRWRAQSFIDTKSFNSFDNFIGKLVQYLSTNQRRTRLNVNYESFYNGNDNVRITAQFFNKNYEFNSNANVSITLTEKTTNTQNTYPFILRNNNYEVDLSGVTAGDYSFTVDVSDENISKSGELKILEYNVEQQFLNANVAKLQNLANESSGQAYFISDTSTIINELLTDSRYIIVQKSTKNVVPLIDWKYLLVLIVLSLAIEWFMRKYNGLI